MPVFSGIVKMFDFQHFEIYKTICFRNVPEVFIDFVLGVLVAPQIKRFGFGARGHVKKSINHINVSFVSISKLKIDVQIEAE